MEPQERSLAVRLLGWVWVAAALMSVLSLVGPGVAGASPTTVLAIAAGCLLAGVALLRLPATAAVLHGALVLGLVTAAVVGAVTGGAHSSGRWILPAVVAFCAAFLPARVAVLYVAAIAAVHALPLIYDPQAGGRFVGELIVALPAYALLTFGGLRTKAGRVVQRETAERLAAEHEALRSVAVAAVRSRRPHEVYARAAEEAGRLLGADASAILRFDGDELEIVGAWGKPDKRATPVGARMPVVPGTDPWRARNERAPQRTDAHPVDSQAGDVGWACTLLTPVLVGEHLWGLAAAVHAEPYGLARDAVARLEDLGEVLGLAVASAEDRAMLAAQAATDPLTGLANHRAFHAAVAAELSRAHRHGRPAALVVLDVDHFKQLNDGAGHEAGDRALGEFAARLREAARDEDVLGRIGGDEFAWLLPESDALPALAAVERLRAELGRRPLSSGVVTVSAGIADTHQAPEAEQLFRHADAALYWSKARGRDAAWVYDPLILRGLSEEERTRHLERTQAILGLRALARAIDAKDPATREHSERVAELSARLATARGWPPSRVALLREAALVHDVGKIGVPDAVLLKPGGLTPGEYEQVKAHAELGARIVADVLRPEQVEWILTHHERPDGEGYPRGLSAADLSEGAGLLAIADAFDVMTRSRSYSLPRPVEEAVDQCRALADRQFAPDAVAALLAVTMTEAQGSARAR